MSLGRGGGLCLGNLGATPECLQITVREPSPPSGCAWPEASALRGENVCSYARDLEWLFHERPFSCNWAALAEVARRHDAGRRPFEMNAREAVRLLSAINWVERSRRSEVRSLRQGSQCLVRHRAHIPR